jgi:transposase
MGSLPRRSDVPLDDVSDHSPRRLDLQKKTVAASERNEALRAAFRAQIAALPAERLVAVDETATTIALARRHARAPRQRRAPGHVPKNHGTPTTLVAALTPSGFGPAMTRLGPIDTAAFRVYVRDLLAPTLRPGQIVLLDNLGAHKATDIRTMIEARACEVLYLPPYSPDFNPIELAFAKFKAHLRRAGPRTQPALDRTITETIDCIPPHEALAFIHHCGYRSLDSEK